VLHIDIPGRVPITLSTLVLDYNGTLARDGRLLDGVAERLTRLADMLHVVVLTADTHGSVASAVQGLPVTVQIIASSGMEGAHRDDDADETGGEDTAKLRAIEAFGAASCAAFGNGRNDALMLRKAALSVALLGDEGLSTDALLAAQVVVKDIRDGLDLLLHPDRIRATLRV